MKRFLLAALAGLSLAPQARALTPAQLAPEEQQTYETLKDDPAAAKSFLDTRGFLRLCRQVAAGKLAPLQLPRQPNDYDSQYVTDDEQTTVDGAVLKYVMARVNAPKKA